MRPSVTGSVRLTHFRSVDFPEPDAPIKHTTSSLRAPSEGTFISAAQRSHATAVALDEEVGEPRERDREQDEVDRRDGVTGEVERHRRVALCLAHRLEDAEERDERRVLLEA